jgi:hypothetical protein
MTSKTYNRLVNIICLIVLILLIITGYQIIFFGLFARIKSGESLPRILTLERGALAGAIIFTSVLVYAPTLALEWIINGFKNLQNLEHDTVASH